LRTRDGLGDLVHRPCSVLLLERRVEADVRALPVGLLRLLQHPLQERVQVLLAPFLGRALPGLDLVETQAAAAAVRVAERRIAHQDRANVMAPPRLRRGLADRPAKAQRHQLDERRQVARRRKGARARFNQRRRGGGIDAADLVMDELVSIAESLIERLLEHAVFSWLGRAPCTSTPCRATTPSVAVRLKNSPVYSMLRPSTPREPS